MSGHPQKPIVATQQQYWTVPLTCASHLWQASMRTSRYRRRYAGLKILPTSVRGGPKPPSRRPFARYPALPDALDPCAQVAHLEKKLGAAQGVNSTLHAELSAAQQQRQAEAVSRAQLQARLLVVPHPSPALRTGCLKRCNTGCVEQRWD